jgi:hypothetical protein
MNDEEHTVSVILADGRKVEGIFSLSEEREDVFLSFKLLSRNLNARASDYFEAMVGIRRELETDGILLHCYGASRSVYPSGMGRDMGAGLKAYKLTIGKRAKKEDLVFIFDTGIDVEPATVSAQKEFYERWLKEPTER